MLLFHGICSWEWCSSRKALVALPWCLEGFVALSIDSAVLISLVLLHVQLSEENRTQHCELSQKFLQSLKSTVPFFFFFWTRQPSNFFTSLLFLTSLQTPISHPPLSILSSFLFMKLLFQLQGSKNIFSNWTLNRSQNSKCCHFFNLTDLLLFISD